LLALLHQLVGQRPMTPLHQPSYQGASRSPTPVPRSGVDQQRKKGGKSYSPLIAAPIRGAAQRNRSHSPDGPRPSNLFSFFFFCFLFIFYFLILFSLFLISFLFFFLIFCYNFWNLQILISSDFGICLNSIFSNLIVPICNLFYF
jgi:hypothetical protein